MGRRGPAPKPTNIVKLEGNRSHRPLPVGEPIPPPGMPACPSFLSVEAKRIWRAEVPRLHRAGLATSIDGMALINLCLAGAQLRQAQAVLDRRGLTFTTPSGYKQQRPEVGIVHHCMAIITRICAEFGMTPSARSRISLGESSTEGDGLGILS